VINSAVVLTLLVMTNKSQISERVAARAQGQSGFTSPAGGGGRPTDMAGRVSTGDGVEFNVRGPEPMAMPWVAVPAAETHSTISQQAIAPTPRSCSKHAYPDGI
jgi:hypothetical protein